MSLKDIGRGAFNIVASVLGQKTIKSDEEQEAFDKAKAAAKLQQETSVLAPGNLEKLKKKKEDELKESALSNSPGVRQQSVLTIR